MCSYAEQKNIPDVAPHCGSAPCWDRYFVTYPARRTVLQKALENGLHQRIVDVMGSKVIKQYYKFEMRRKNNAAK